MKIYVSVDMEGVTGLTDPEEMRAGGRGYERGCELMTGDANAAVDGAFAGGAGTVVVNDAHSSTRNLRIESIDPRCTLIRGPYRPMQMGQGLDETTALAMFVGYHARTGVPHGVLNHTWMGREILNLYLNDEIAGEIRLIAGLAGSLGVPVGLVTGDEAACAEAREVLGEVETVAVKAGIDRYAAELVPPERARRAIREAAERAVDDRDRFTPYVVPPPYRLGIEWNTTAAAHACALVPGVERTGPRETLFETADYREVMAVMGVLAMLVNGSVACTGMYYG